MFTKHKVERVMAAGRFNHDRSAEWRQGPDQLAAVEGMWRSGGGKFEANPMHLQISFF